MTGIDATDDDDDNNATLIVDDSPNARAVATLFGAWRNPCLRSAPTATATATPIEDVVLHASDVAHLRFVGQAARKYLICVLAHRRLLVACDQVRLCRRARRHAASDARSRTVSTRSTNASDSR